MLPIELSWLGSLTNINLRTWPKCGWIWQKIKVNIFIFPDFGHVHLVILIQSSKLASIFTFTIINFCQVIINWSFPLLVEGVLGDLFLNYFPKCGQIYWLVWINPIFLIWVLGILNPFLVSIMAAVPNLLCFKFCLHIL